FRDSDFLLEEVDAFLALEDDPTLPKVDHSYFDIEGGILLPEAFLNDDPSLPPPTQRNPWVSLVHCVLKKGGFTVVEKEENELIPSRLVTGWRLCIYYRKLNETTHKDHFPLPFMDPVLKRLAGNEYYCLSMVSRVTFKFPSILKIKKKPHSRVLTKRLPIIACLLAYAMHRAHSKGV
nr:reverse transcriptase domain-containing protein [Tanacetum cinerariifolium]